jgi:hypothetical protein
MLSFALIDSYVKSENVFFVSSLFPAQIPSALMLCAHFSLLFLNVNQEEERIVSILSSFSQSKAVFTRQGFY